MITRVTITGADDSVKPPELVGIWEQFPFVEWGILVSRKHYGAPRYPSRNWLDALRMLKFGVPEMPLSMHLCGGYVRELAGEEVDPVLSLWLGAFERVQLNFHAIPHENTQNLLRNLASCGLFKEYIFQHDGVNDGMIRIIQESGIATSALFDKSGGAGILPAEWPELLDGVKCGYAGGLSPENLKEQIELIEKKAGEANIWIDMETHVRSHADAKLDLDKVVRCLEIAAPYVTKL